MEYEHATFAAGCFWGIQSAFEKKLGIINTTVGYMGGHTKNPTYKQVCTNTTGHAEVLQITFNPEQITYQELLTIFWDIHDPTQYHRQGPDIGSQYRSAIFYHTPTQKIVAEQSKKQQQQSGKYSKEIVTEITPATNFYPAEDYHQHYFEKQGINACPI